MRPLCPVSVEYAPPMIKRLLIANRGEIAVRIIRACRELGIESVAVYSDADAQARHVVAADRAVAIGPAPAAESYLSIPRLLDAARSTGADAVHPGYGFLSENAAFAEACEQAGLIFVGPPAAVIAQMGSKIEARRLVAAAGVPVVPGETPDDQSDRGLRQAVERVGLPALVKASAGGGGKGMRTIREAGGDRRGDPGGAARGGRRVRRRHALRRAARRAAAARRGPDLRRRPRTRRAPLRARVLGAAPPPESDRGKPVACADAARCARASRRPRSPRRGPRTTATPAPSSSSSIWPAVRTPARR